MNYVRELARAFRELADLYEELANIEENEELNTQQKEEAQELVLGKIMLKVLKTEQLKKSKEEN